MNQGELNQQADKIEGVTARNHAPVTVTGGHVTPRWVQFLVQPGQGVKVNRVESLSREIAAALGVPQAKVTRSGGAVRIDVPRRDPQPVQLAAMLKRIPADRVPRCTALLGLADDGAPLLARFPSPEVGHVLISGKAGIGKTSLIVAMLLSLAYYSKPRHVQIVAIGSGLAGLRDLPHMLKVDDLQRLIERPSVDPRIVIAIDEPRPVDLPVVRELVTRGAAAGVHCIVSTTERMNSDSLACPVRIIADEQPGNFWAEYNGHQNSPMRFDAAHIAAGEIASFIQTVKGQA
jgi:hypothetical protein